jgi:hypothetical protein
VGLKSLYATMGLFDPNAKADVHESLLGDCTSLQER